MNRQKNITAKYYIKVYMHNIHATFKSKCSNGQRAMLIKNVIYLLYK